MQFYYKQTLLSTLCNNSIIYLPPANQKNIPCSPPKRAAVPSVQAGGRHAGWGKYPRKHICHFIPSEKKESHEVAL